MSNRENRTRENREIFDLISRIVRSASVLSSQACSAVYRIRPGDRIESLRVFLEELDKFEYPINALKKLARQRLKELEG